MIVMIIPLVKITGMTISFFDSGKIRTWSINPIWIMTGWLTCDNTTTGRRNTNHIFSTSQSHWRRAFTVSYKMTGIIIIVVVIIVLTRISLIMRIHVFLRGVPHFDWFKSGSSKGSSTSHSIVHRWRTAQAPRIAALEYLMEEIWTSAYNTQWS